MECLDTQLHAVRSGSGQALVLLHGWGQNMYMMKFLQEHLKERYDVLNLDLPGFGESAEPPKAWSIGEYAAWLRSLLFRYGMEEPILIAHSFGARIALYYASRYPCKALILTGAAGILPQRSWWYHVRVYTYKLLRKLHIKAAMGSEDYVQATTTMRGVLVQAVNEDLRPLLPSIPCETLLVWGEKDTQTPLWMGKLMEQEIPHATLLVMEKEDHFAYFHQSLRFQCIIDAFLERNI